MKTETTLASPTKYHARDFEHLLGMRGFSDKLLKDHLKIYQSYVAKTNESVEKLAYARNHDQNPAEITEIKRRLGWEHNGMRLHEYYFDNLGGIRPLSSSSTLASLIQFNFGTLNNWKKDFIHTGLMRGIGWVILYQEPKTENLFNVWIEEHHGHHLSGAQPLLVMDVFEHAYLPDYGMDRVKYIDAFFRNIDWEIVEQRTV